MNKQQIKTTITEVINPMLTTRKVLIDNTTYPGDDSQFSMYYLKDVVDIVSKTFDETYELMISKKLNQI